MHVLWRLPDVFCIKVLTTAVSICGANREGGGVAVADLVSGEAASRNILGFYFTFLLAHIKNKNNKLQDFEKIL